MKQGQFETLYKNQWAGFEQSLEKIESQGKRFSRITSDEKMTGEQSLRFSHDYREICHLYAIAKERNYSSFLIDYLGDLVVRGHQQLYQKKVNFFSNLIEFLIRDFPRLVRREYKYLWSATLLLYLPAFIMTFLVIYMPESVYTIVDPGMVMGVESMYDPENRVLGEARESETNWFMFGYYIYNNISISFQTFASGLLYGVGSIFFLVYNGLFFGAITGHLVNVGYTDTFFSFVVGHGSFELTAITISGAAGLKLGFAVLSPGNLSRRQALINSSHDAIRLMFGVIVMLLIAAFIEAFWSANGWLASSVKYWVGAGLWFFVILYLTFGGKAYGSR